MSVHLFHIYTEENNKWQHTLNIQRVELPVMRQVLQELIKNQPAEKNVEAAGIFNYELELQEEIIEQIIEKIQLQQQKLEILDELNKSPTNSETAFYDQEELRDVVFRFEKNYLNLKQKIQTYLLSVL